MARIDVVMPQMGESIAEGTLSRWLKKVGDEVKRDEPLFEISTDKVDAEIPAPSGGVLAEIIVTEGQTVPVQTVVARLETEKGAAISAPAAAVPAPAAAASAPAAATPATPAADRAAPAATTNGNDLESRLRTKSSPLVRKIAAEHGIDLAALQGSGIQGRVTRRDIEQFIEAGVPTKPARRTAAARRAPASSALPPR